MVPNGMPDMSTSCSSLRAQRVANSDDFAAADDPATFGAYDLAARLRYANCVERRDLPHEIGALFFDRVGIDDSDRFLEARAPHRDQRGLALGTEVDDVDGLDRLRVASARPSPTGRI